MHNINFSKPIKAIKVNSEDFLMDQLLSQNIPVASSCGGEGVCGKCIITINKGIGNISPVETLEKTKLESLKANNYQRLCCQVKVIGDVEIDASYW